MNSKVTLKTLKTINSTILSTSSSTPADRPTNMNCQLSRIVLPEQWTGLEEQTECPVCADFLIGQIRMCTRGHSICQKCVDVVRSCPLCRKEMSQVRNYFLEFFMDHCSFKCKYYDQGCTAELKNMDYFNHTAQCHFREVRCRDVCDDDLCDTITNFNDFLAHLNHRHDIRNFKNGVDYCYRFPRDVGKLFQTPYASIEFDGKTFFYNFATYPMTNSSGKQVTFALWWVSYFNPSNDSTKYNCKIRISSRQDKDMVMTWSGPVLDFRVTAEKVVFENQCLSCTLPQLKKFCSDDDQNPCYLFSHVENAEIIKVENTARPMLSDSIKDVVVLQNEQERQQAREVS